MFNELLALACCVAVGLFAGGLVTANIGRRRR